MQALQLQDLAHDRRPDVRRERAPARMTDMLVVKRIYRTKVGQRSWKKPPAGKGLSQIRAESLKRTTLPTFSVIRLPPSLFSFHLTLQQARSS